MRWCIYLVLALLLACAGSRPAPKKQNYPRPPAYAILFHADTAFTPVQRDHIRNACTAWTLFSHGRTRVGVSFDLDFGDTTSIERYHYGPMIMAVDSHFPAVAAVDRGAMGEVLAWTDVEQGRVCMVLDRIVLDVFYPTILHEIGHALHVAPDHTANPRGDVMSKYVSSKVTFTASDFAACLTAGVCQ